MKLINLGKVTSETRDPQTPPVEYDNEFLQTKRTI